MPAALTYPGVYVEEIPSGVRTIVGVGTSITAFVGRTKYGPTNKALMVNGYADFERKFGGIWEKSRLGHAVHDFFLNGGSQAVIVRLFREGGPGAEGNGGIGGAKGDEDGAGGGPVAPGAGGPPAKKQKGGGGGAEPVAAGADGPVPKKRQISVAGLPLEAADEGEWGRNLRVAADVDVTQDAADRLGLPLEELFNLIVRDASDGEVEQYRNVTVKDGPRQIKALLRQSNLVKWIDGVDEPKILPDEIKAAVEARDALKAELATPDAQGDDAAGQKQSRVDTKKAALEAALEKLRDPVSIKELALAAARQSGKIDEIREAQNAVIAEIRKLKVSDGAPLQRDDFIGLGTQANSWGIYALAHADLFNLLCIPPYNATNDVDTDVIAAAAAYCEDRRAMLLVDPPSGWTSKDRAKDGLSDIGTNSKNAALFFPRLEQPDPLAQGQTGTFAPSGAVAGVFARTDSARGVWKAPAGFEAALVGVSQLSVPLTDLENGELNPLGINCLRSMPAAGRVVWGSRTMQGDDRLASEWKYIPVRRTALFIEESIFRGTGWVVFEPNDEPLWAQIRLNVGAFMNNLYRQGAFQGQTPRDAYFVKCDKETTTQNDIDRGIVNIRVGFAPLKPAEFVVIKLQQIAGQIQT